MREPARRGRPPGDGGARERLIRACWQLLTEQHDTGQPVSVARICTAAGCTPPTLYHHFADLDALREAACTRAFEQWAAGLEQRIGPAGPPAQRLRRRGRAYLDWGLRHPAAYRVLFVDPPSRDGVRTGPGHGFTELLNDLAALSGAAPDDPRVFTAAMAHWSAVHGLTCLAIANPDLPEQARTAVLDYLSRALTEVRSSDGTSS